MTTTAALDELRQAGYACYAHPTHSDYVVVADPVQSSVEGLIYEHTNVHANAVYRFLNARS